MATLTVYSGFNLDMTRADSTSIFAGDVRFSDFLIEFVVSNTFFTEAHGFYYYDAFGTLIGGNVTGIYEYFDGFRAFQVDGLNMEVFTTLNYVNNFDLAGC